MFPFYLVFIIGFVYFLIDRKGTSPVYLALFFLYLALFVGLGDMIGGYDRYIYGATFDAVADATRSDKDYTKLLYLVDGNEYGYFLWQILVSYITANRYVYILITTIVMYILFFYSFRRYIDRYPIAAIVFLGLFYYFTMTYLRQVMATGIVWLSIRYIWERKPIKFFLLIALAYSFHSSAIVFAIMYFIPIRKYPPMLVLAFVVFCFLFGLTPIPQALMASSTERAAGYEDEVQGFRIEYVLEAAFFLLIILSNYGKLGTTKKRFGFCKYKYCVLWLATSFYEVWARRTYRMVFFYGANLYFAKTMLCKEYLAMAKTCDYCCFLFAI